MTLYWKVFLVGKTGYLQLNIYTGETGSVFSYRKYSKLSRFWQPERRELKIRVFGYTCKVEWRRLTKQDLL